MTDGLSQLMTKVTFYASCQCTKQMHSNSDVIGESPTLEGKSFMHTSLKS